jgi:hypothetical protein
MRSRKSSRSYLKWGSSKMGKCRVCHQSGSGACTIFERAVGELASLSKSIRHLRKRWERLVRLVIGARPSGSFGIAWSTGTLVGGVIDKGWLSHHFGGMTVLQTSSCVFETTHLLSIPPSCMWLLNWTLHVSQSPSCKTIPNTSFLMPAPSQLPAPSAAP